MEKYKLSIVSKTLNISKAFEKAAADPTSEEYALYMKLTQEIPDLKVCRQTHKTPSRYRNGAGEVFTCNQFKNLTYEKMEKFMAALPNGSIYLSQYECVRAAATALTAPYALVCRWFIKQFPEFRTAPWIYFEKKAEVIKAADMIKPAV